MAKILFIIAPTDFRDEEYFEPKKVLEALGHTTITASTVYDTEGFLGAKVKADILIRDAHQQDYDAVVFVGGRGTFAFHNNKQFLDLAKAFYSAEKLTTAICAGPIFLANAGLLEGKKATCYPGGEEALTKPAAITNKGAIYTAANVEKDGIIITADGPSSAKSFGKVIAQNLKN